MEDRAAYDAWHALTGCHTLTGWHALTNGKGVVATPLTSPRPCASLLGVPPDWGNQTKPQSTCRNSLLPISERSQAARLINSERADSDAGKAD
jgi:hypothetical protein